jgi:hypothetical protein
MSKKCTNCGWEKPVVPKAEDEEKTVHCGLCNEDVKKKDVKEHKKKNTHLIKQDIIKKIRDLDPNVEEEKKTINKIFGSLTPKYKKGLDAKNMLE